MLVQSSISKQLPGQESLNIERLRELGIKYIQELSGKIWTDYNVHDPGVTALESLSYAITDLGLRAGLPIENILPYRTAEKYPGRNFYSPLEVLPSNPLTINDFRKILLDHPKIKNAWLEMSEETEQIFYYDEVSEELSYIGGEEISLTGLYKVLLEFEEDEVLGNLNSSILYKTITVSTGSGPVPIEVEFAFPFWDEMPQDWGTILNLMSIEVLEVPGSPGEKLISFPENSIDDYFAEVLIKYNVDKSFKFGIRIKINTENTLPENDLKNAIIDELEISGTEIIADPSVLDNSIFTKFNQKIIAAGSIIEEIKYLIQGYRNLCEDFFSFKAARVQEISISADIEVYNESNIEKILALIYYEIDQFLSPPVRFYTLSEMLGKNTAIEEILEGPLLNNGFVMDDELENLGKREVIYTSDIYNIITSIDIEDIEEQGNQLIAVSNLTVTNYINNQELTHEMRNCLKLTRVDLYKPKLSISKSNIRVYKKGETLSFDKNLVLTEFDALRDSALSISHDPGLDSLILPNGQKLNIEKYHSVQYDFPSAYGLGDAGIPEISPDVEDAEAKKALREAQVKQLRAYLLFFEQLLANYLSQLTHTTDLFSLNPYLDKVYFYQPLYELPGIQDLLHSYASGTETWEDFIANPDNNYVKTLKIAIQKEDDFLDRRNRFLDHLLARFSENFIEYALLLKNELNGQSRLIEDKIELLKEYPVIGKEKGKAFNYIQHDGTDPDVWLTDNVSGLEKRVTKLLGIQNYRRRNLFNDYSTYFQILEVEPGSFRVYLRNDDGQIILYSRYYPSFIAAQNAIPDLVKYGVYRSNYRIIFSQVSKQYYARLYPGFGGIRARIPARYETKEELYLAIDETIEFLKEKYSNEGIYVLEHILLRPKRKNVTVTALTKISDKLLPLAGELKDPYTFCLSVILPSGKSPVDPSVIVAPERFANPDFRALAEKIIQRETPAHIKPYIYWVDEPLLKDFEDALKTWLETNASSASTDIELVEAQNELADRLTDIINT